MRKLLIGLLVTVLVSVSYTHLDYQNDYQCILSYEGSWFSIITEHVVGLRVLYIFAHLFIHFITSRYRIMF